MSNKAGEAKSRGRPADPSKAKTGEGYQFAEWLNTNLRDLTSLTNEELAEELDYNNANIVSMWTTGRTKIPLPVVFGMAKIFNIDASFLLALWVEQYAGRSGYTELMKVLNRTVSEEEAKFVELMRKATDGKRKKLTAAQEREIIRIVRS